MPLFCKNKHFALASIPDKSYFLTILIIYLYIWSVRIYNIYERKGKLSLYRMRVTY